MGGIVGGVIGGIGALSGGSKAKSADLTGFNYLTGKSGVTSDVTAGSAATSNIGQLLGTQPMQQGTQSGLNNYLNSTGYNFQLQQGSQAITGSAAARGVLNSGATGKALTKFGQSIGGEYFNNYLNQLGGQAQRGLTASGQIGAAGTQGGVAAGGAQQTAATGFAGNVAGGLANSPMAQNFFGSL